MNATNSRIVDLAQDGFVLNIAYQDTINPNGNVQNQLNNVFAAADTRSDFKLFLSFDYLDNQQNNAWDSGTLTNTINAYKTRRSYYLFNGRPLTSTFEGFNFASTWTSVKANTGAFFMPQYSAGPSASANAPNVDGLFSWEAWPVGATDMTTNPDNAYKAALGSKPYIMPVSPWFYRNVNSLNWLWRGDDMWHQRWQQVLQIQPDIVEIISWNDWGESHYIGTLPPSDASVPDGAEWYVDFMPHNAWLNDLPFYIAAYKGEAAPINQNHITMWYKLNPGQSCSAAGTVCNAPWQTPTSPWLCSTDRIFFTAFVPSSNTATVTVKIGDNAARSVTASAPGIFHSSIPFDGQTGTVVISATSNNGGPSLGPVTCPAITTNCVNGNVKWNAWVGGS